MFLMDGVLNSTSGGTPIYVTNPPTRINLIVNRQKTMQSQILQILTRWTERTEMVLDRERKRLKVGKSGELDRSFQTRVLTVSQDLFESQIDFLMRGRFVDMGAGRGRKIESQATEPFWKKKAAESPKSGTAVPTTAG
jgi:hypothetical protein